MSIRVSFRVGILRLKGEDTPRLERAVDRMRMHARDAESRARDYEAAAKRFRALLLRTAERAFLDG